LNFKLTIVSGGQTGVDRAALEWALTCRFPHGGWCPKGRKAEDGAIPRRFNLKETPSPNYAVRTLWNVRDSDGTVIFSKTRTLTGGTKQTAVFVRKLRKPCIHLIRSLGVKQAATQLTAFIKENQLSVLNAAGPRASEQPYLGRFVKAVLSRTFRQGPASTSQLETPAASDAGHFVSHLSITLPLTRPAENATLRQ
jgi:hypothetical protein